MNRDVGSLSCMLNDTSSQPGPSWLGFSIRRTQAFHGGLPELTRSLCLLTAGYYSYDFAPGADLPQCSTRK